MRPCKLQNRLITFLAISLLTASPLLVVETTLMASSLGDLLDAKKPVPFEAVRDILLAIGGALDKAHSLGIVHGGILPEKIFTKI